MKLFAQINKVDEAKRLVYGRAADETVDKSDEALNYAESKPHFVKWSEDISKDTEGKSLGNVRAMHGKVAAGKLTEISFDDEARSIDVCAKVVDDNEWKKVLEGVYTGFSIGGSYGAKTVEKIDDRSITRYVAIPSEISLVDRPCIPTAKFFEVQKADGSLQKVEFIGAGSGDIDGGTVEGTPEQVDEMTKLMNAGGMNVGSVVELLKREFDAKQREKAAESGAVEAVEKADGCPDGCDQAEWNKMSAAERETYLADNDGDEAEKLAKKTAAEQLAKEEAAQAAAEEALTKLEVALADALEKIGARNSKMDKGRIDAIHKAAVELGADCSGAAEKVEKIETPDLAKLVAEAVAPLQKSLAEAQEKIQKLEAQPAPARVALRAVSKAADAGGAEPQFTEGDLVKGADGAVHPAASLIKGLHQTGGQPLAMYRG